MDLGATLCTRSAPKCADCPVRRDCHALAQDRVAELPTPRKRKTVPTRRAFFLLAIADDAILLEQRPPTGIWSSLLVPPQFATIRSMRDALAGLAAGARVRPLSARNHGFSHFTLAYTPYMAQVEKLPPRVCEPHQRWVPLDELGGAPLPAPMQVLLGEVRELLAHRRQRVT
jgi:A/G-specific adenine glycosylase